MSDGREDSAGPGTPSGRQFVLSAGGTQAIVAEVGGGLRELSVGGAPLLWGYPADTMAAGGRGQLLAPWPNRLADGTYTFGGLSCRAPLDEPDRHNAIHGLVRWLLWSEKSREADRLVLGCEIAPQPAYPWRLALEVGYEVSAGQVVVEVSAENRSAVPAPFGFGAHPYLAAGPGGVDACSLQVPAGRRLVLDERGLPTASEEVAGGSYDFRSGRSLAGVRLDDCFTSLGAGPALEAGAGAAWAVRLERPGGASATVWGDGAFGYVMCYTGDTLPVADRRHGMAVEPMTCPPNAFRSGESVVTIPPGGHWNGRFGIRGTGLTAQA